MTFYLATSNKHKKQEMSQILCPHTVITPTDEGIEFDPIEDGTTFYENSIIKAKALYEIVHCPVIADDSGICVDALGGVPGIYSSRYAGPSAPKGIPGAAKTPQQEQNKMLIQQLNDALLAGAKTEGFLNGPRSAHYTCSMVLYAGGDRLFVSQETMEGTIVKSIEDSAGTGGFGYDPIFFLPQYQKTAAELTAEQKNQISHRGKATRALLSLIKDLF